MNSKPFGRNRVYEMEKGGVAYRKVTVGSVHHLGTSLAWGSDHLSFYLWKISLSISP